MSSYASGTERATPRMRFALDGTANVPDQVTIYHRNTNVIYSTSMTALITASSGDNLQLQSIRGNSAVSSVCTLNNLGSSITVQRIL